MPELTKDNGGPTEAAGVFSWIAPKKAVNPYLDPADVAPVTPVKRKWICFCVAAACHLELGCACSTGISAYRRMTNGVNGTDSSEKWHIY